MNKENVKNVLKAHAEDNVPPNPNLWPRINTNLQTTFTGPEPHTAREFHPRRRVIFAGALGTLAALLILFVALGGAGMFGVAPPRPASAAELVAQAQKAEGKIRSFHGIWTSEHRNSPTEDFSYTRSERWYLAPNKTKSESHIKAYDGTESTLSWLTNGETGWKYDSYFGKVWPLTPNELKGTSYAFTNLEATLNTDYARQFFNGRVSGMDKVDGRDVYIVDLTVKPADELPQNSWPGNTARIQMHVDAEYFFPLTFQTWDAEGNVLATEQYESYEVNAPVDPEIFNQAPPSTAP